MGKVLLIDITRCNGCYNCQLSCKDEHVGNDWSPIAKPQPNTGHFWYKITETVQGTVPKVRVHYMHEMCQHCEDAPCLEACKNNAIYKREKDGFIIIDPEKCRGTRSCVDACPYGSIYFNADLNIAQKCTMCAHLLDDGWEEPRCVQSCPVDVYTYAEYDEVKDKIAKEGFERLHPEFGLKTRIYYKGLLNKFFIAGDVYDPELDECLEGAKVALIDAKGKKAAELKTDVFGDFWFERCEPGVYSVKVEMAGYKAKVIENIDATTKDINIGGIELVKA
ncbi:MAG: 4Fe-4S dicluster domain-containing protein [Lachnospiraceae bacterium]|jgi:tetrathionate reductase subunit B